MVINFEIKFLIRIIKIKLGVCLENDMLMSRRKSIDISQNLKEERTMDEINSENSSIVITYENNFDNNNLNPLHDYLYENNDIRLNNDINRKSIFKEKIFINQSIEYNIPFNFTESSSQKNSKNKDLILMDKESLIDKDYLKTKISESNDSVVEEENENSNKSSSGKYQKITKYKLQFNEIVKYDPLFFQTAIFAINLTIDNHVSVLNNEKFLQFLDKNEKNITFFLEILNTDKYAYNYFCMIAFIYENFSISPESACYEKVNSLTNKYIIKLIKSIIMLIHKIITYDSEDLLIKKKFILLNSEFNNRERENIMIKYISSNNQKVKSNVMKVILNVHHDQIDQSELDDFVKNLEGSNFIENKKEHMISLSLIFIMKKFESQFKEYGFIPLENKESLLIAYNFAIKNLEVYEKERIKEKSNLAMMLSLFFINNSMDDKFLNKILKENQEELIDLNIKLIENEINFAKSNKENELFHSPEILPFLYEKNCFFLDPIFIYKILSSFKIMPFNYVVYRIFKRMAATLHGYTISNINFNITNDKNNILVHIENLFKSIEYHETIIEKKGWAKFKKLKKFLNLKNFNEINKNTIELGNSNFSKFDLIFEDYLKDDYEESGKIGKGVINGVFFSEIKEKQLISFHRNFCEKLEFFLDFIIGDVSDNTIKNQVYNILFTNKFDPRLKNLLLKDIEVNEENKSDDSNEEKTKKQKHKNFEFIKNTEKELKSNLLNIKLDRYNKSKITECYNYILDDMNSEITNYGSSKENINRKSENENVHNRNLRCLLTSAFLRCIYSLIKKEEFHISDEQSKKTDKLINKTGYSKVIIEKLRNVEVFKKLIFITDSSKLKSCNISSKILKIIKSVFTGISSNINKEEYDLPKLVSITAIIIEKIIEILSQFDSDNVQTETTIKCLIKSCLFIYREINSKEHLSHKIISSNLIQIIILKITKNMENDKIAIEDNDGEYKFFYNKIYVEVLMLLSEFMKNDKICYFIIESFYKKIYLNKKILRKSFVRDLNELSLNVIFASEIMKYSENKIKKIIYLSIVDYYNYNFKREYEFKVLILYEEYIHFYPYNNTYSNFDPKGETEEMILKKILGYINKEEDKSYWNNENNKNKIFPEYIKMDISSLRCIYYSHFKNRLFLEFASNDKKIPNMLLTILFRKSVDMMIFCKKIFILNNQVLFILCPFYNLSKENENYHNNDKSDFLNSLNFKNKLDKKLTKLQDDELNKEYYDEKNNNCDKKIDEIKDKSIDSCKIKTSEDELENKIKQLQNEKILGLEDFKRLHELQIKIQQNNNYTEDENNKVLNENEQKKINIQYDFHNKNQNLNLNFQENSANLNNEKNEETLEKQLKKMKIIDDVIMVSIKVNSLFNSFFPNEDNFISNKRILLIKENNIYIFREKEDEIKNIFKSNYTNESVYETMCNSYEEENVYSLDEVKEALFENINQIYLKYKWDQLNITTLDDRTFILLKAKILNYLKVKRGAKKI